MQKKNEEGILQKFQFIVLQIARHDIYYLKFE